MVSTPPTFAVTRTISALAVVGEVPAGQTVALNGTVGSTVPLATVRAVPVVAGIGASETVV